MEPIGLNVDIQKMERYITMCITVCKENLKSTNGVALEVLL